MKLLDGSLAICVAVLGASLAMAVDVGAATNQAPAPPAYSGGSASANVGAVDDATLKRTAAAYVKVQNITQKELKVVNNTNDTASKRQLIRQAESEKVNAVKQQGMQPQQYNQVILLVQNNDQLKRKFLSYVHQAEGGGANGTM